MIVNKEVIWNTYGQKLFKTESDCTAEHERCKFKWFKAEKVLRAKDFEWEIAIAGKELGTEKHKPLILMKRTWKSLRDQLPEKANKKRLRKLRKEAEAVNV